MSFVNLVIFFGNNVNKYLAEKKSFEGAMVNDPTHNSDYAKLKQNGEVFNIAKTWMIMIINLCIQV